MSPSLRWWPSWWWPLVHLRSFRCRLLDGSHYTRPTYVVQIEPTQTTPKPLQTLAFIGVSQPHDGDTKTADTTATAAPRHGHTQGRHGHVTTAMSRDVTTSRARRPRHGHDGRDTATATTRPRSHTKERARVIPHDTPKHNRTNVPMLHHATNIPVGECPPGSKSKAACSLVLTLNARWNIFGLPVTYEVFTYLVVATVSAPYILCIMFLGLMLMVVERSSGPHRYLAAITHCA